MPSHEQLWRISKECRADAGIIVARIAADMLDEHIHILDLESVQFTIHQPQITTIAIATDSPERTESSQFLSHLHTADITCMPNLVTRFEVMQILIVPIAVRIAQYTYSFHISNRFNSCNGALQSLHIPPQHGQCHSKRAEITGWHRVPDTIEPPEHRKHIRHRQQKEQLA